MTEPIKRLIKKKLGSKTRSIEGLTKVRPLSTKRKIQTSTDPMRQKEELEKPKLVEVLLISNGQPCVRSIISNVWAAIGKEN